MVIAIEARGLARRFGETVAVSGLDLAVREGEVFGFLGPNGAGKTTTIRMLTGALAPTSGTARVLGAPVDDLGGLSRSIGVVLGENIAPEPSFSAIRYLRYFGRMHGLPREETDRRAKELLGLLRLELRDAERPIGALSGGNRRKVEIARALLHRPRALFLDEPTRELDLPSRRAVWRLLRESAREKGVSVFLSSHDPEEIAYVCDRLVVVHGGRTRWHGTPEEARGNAAHLTDGLAHLLETA